MMIMATKRNCDLCGVSFAPKKKASICNSCKQGFKKRARAGMSHWELQMKEVLEQELPKYIFIDNGKFSFMRSPKGAPLELDRYYPEIEVAFEFDGEQHYTYNEFFHKSQEQFEYYQLCDKIKNRECEERGITLIRIRQGKYKDASTFRDLLHKILKKK